MTFTVKRGDGCDEFWLAGEHIADANFDMQLIQLIGAPNDIDRGLARRMYAAAKSAGWPNGQKEMAVDLG